MPSNDEIRSFISNSSLSLSDWFQHALRLALERDPQQVAADAGLLSIVLDHRANSMGALSVALKAILEAKRNGST